MPIDITKPKLSINELAAKRLSCQEAKRANLPCNEFQPVTAPHLPLPLATVQIAFAKPCGHYGQANRSCTLFGRCKEADRVERGEARALTGCAEFIKKEDYRTGLAPDLLPGLRDPLPVPELRTVPGDWPTRPDVQKAHIAAFRKLLDAKIPPPARAEGEGIVLCGGGLRFWPMLCVAVRMCREVSDLPIKIFHRGDDEPVTPSDLADVPNVEIIDGAKYPCRILRGWEMKSLALLHCGWEKVLFLDADAYPVSDVRPLMDLATVERPFVFWQDFPNQDVNIRWEMTGIDAAVGQAVPCVQGGQFACNRKAMWRELVLFHWLNQHSDYYYQIGGYGDQAQWRIAFATGNGYHCLGRAPWRYPAFVCTVNGGPPVIVHRPQGKMFSLADYKPALHLPGEEKAARFLQQQAVGSGNASEVFGRVYASGLWGHADRSGGGSTAKEAAPYLEIVNRMVQFERWSTVVDLGCGDGYISARIEVPHLIGVDCYGQHLERLRNQHPDLEWVHLDLDFQREQLPCGDVAFLKDVMQHWPDDLVREWVEWARASGRWKALVICNDNLQSHPSLALGGYRGLDPKKEPLRSITGLTVMGTYLHKTVCLLRTPK